MTTPARIALLTLAVAGAVSATVAAVLLWMILTRPMSLIAMLAGLPAV